MLKLHAECVACLLDSELRRAGAEPDPMRRTEYLCRVCALLGEADPSHDSAPLLDARITRLRREFLGNETDYAPSKCRFNALMLEIYGALRERVWAAEDPLCVALQLCAAGNFIDFRLFGEVRPEDALHMLDEAASHALDGAECAYLREDLARGGELVFIHDNCGEVVLDKLLLETIRELYPDVRLVSLLRGGPVSNDATREDAAQIRLGEVAELLDNATPDLPGTQLDLLPDEVRTRLERATLIIAKGQGNLESLTGCGLNVYYLLLSKCPHYAEWFGYAHMRAVLANELRGKGSEA